MRVKLILAYNGTCFLGSQIQTQTSNTIIGQIQQALKKLGIDSKLIASGRTDKGVHATCQVCHLDLPAFWQEPSKLKQVLNKMLPNSIYVKYISRVSDEFHARYSAKKRTYRYLIKKGNSTPFQADFITFLQEYNIVSIQENIQLFLGEHDFRSFMKIGSNSKSSTREIYKAFAYEHKGYLILYFEANGFLRSQIRLMVGALLTLNAEDIKTKLQNRSNIALKPAPPNGLYLSKITY